MCIPLPRVKWMIHFRKGFYEIELTDWSDVKFKTFITIIWSEESGVYCPVETAHTLEDYSQLLFPGFATTRFEEIPWSTYIDQMKG